jgi:hypothetical protein
MATKTIKKAPRSTKRPVEEVVSELTSEEVEAEEDRLDAEAVREAKAEIAANPAPRKTLDDLRKAFDRRSGSSSRNRGAGLAAIDETAEIGAVPCLGND